MIDLVINETYLWRDATVVLCPTNRAVSRGVFPEKMFVCHKWWQSPEFISLTESVAKLIRPKNIPEGKRERVLLTIEYEFPFNCFAETWKG